MLIYIWQGVFFTLTYSKFQRLLFTLNWLSNFVCDFSSRLRWKVSWVSWQQKSSHVFLAWRRNAKLSHWSWKSGRNRLRKKLQNFWVKAFTAISFWLLSVATSGPTKITLTIPIKAYLQRFIYSCLQKRSFILGTNTATKQQKLCTQCTSLAHS